ncbi:MAG: hypothetical protein WC197_05155, partial [Candidatus Gastranaerophilaceae bacterium]
AYSFIVDGITITSSVTYSNSGSTISTTGASSQNVQTASAMLTTATALINLINKGGIDTSSPEMQSYLSSLMQLSLSAIETLAANGISTNSTLTDIINNFQTAVTSNSNASATLINSYNSINGTSATSIGDVFTDVTTKTVSVNALAETIVKELEMATDFQKGGALATDYANATSDLLSYLKNNPDMNKDIQDLISVYSADVSNLATSITYDITPSMLQLINNYQQSTMETAIMAATTAANSVLSLLSPSAPPDSSLPYPYNMMNINDYSYLSTFISNLSTSNLTTWADNINELQTALENLSPIIHVPGVAEILPAPQHVVPSPEVYSYQDQYEYHLDNMEFMVHSREGNYYARIYIDWVYYEFHYLPPNYLPHEKINDITYYFLYSGSMRYAIPIDKIFTCYGGYFGYTNQPTQYYKTSASTSLDDFAITIAGGAPGIAEHDEVDTALQAALISAISSISAINSTYNSTTDSYIPDVIAAMLADGTITPEFVVQNIHVYTEGNYNEILNCSYDASVLQNLLEGDSSTIETECGIR